MTAERFLAVVATLDEASDYTFTVDGLQWGDARLRLRYSERFLLPGGTISGPVMFTLCDTALWAAVWAATGSGHHAATADMTLHFLRRPRPVDLLAHARVLRAGRRLVYGEVTLWSDGDDEPVCHATGTYARADQPTGS